MQNCREFNESPRSDSTQAGSAEETVWEPPKDLPACYEKLRDENGITEDKLPVQCPCFINPKDPTGQYRQLSSITLTADLVGWIYPSYPFVGMSSLT